MGAKKRILLAATHSSIEPLGLLHLAGLARDMGWERKIVLVKDHDFREFFERVRDFKPDVVGFNIYTGNHLQTYKAFDRLRRESSGIATIIGGPHATYFPADALEHADYVVMSEGFDALRRILSGEVPAGKILPMVRLERFPHPDRATLYRDSHEHAASPIKSMLTMTGCPYDCTYCYNSSTPEDIKDGLPREVAEQIASAMGMGGRLFPHNLRDVSDVIREAQELADGVVYADDGTPISCPTKLVYCQDDVFGLQKRKKLENKGLVVIKKNPVGEDEHWLSEFAERWPREVGVPFHAQMRWEMTKNPSRLDLVQKAGCTGLTLAIEAADQHIRKEVLHREMPEDTMFDGMRDLVSRGFTVRTEQITALPYGATSQPTRMNLDADLELVELNVRLREETGGPTMAWFSTLAPYARTKLGEYCIENGHYAGWQNHDVPDTFFDSSVLRFPRAWIGPSLRYRKNDPAVWLPPEALARYREQNAELRRLGYFFTLVPKGHVLAKAYLESREPFSYERLGRDTEAHLKALAPNNAEARKLLEQSDAIRALDGALTEDPEEKTAVATLAPYFGCIPDGESNARRFLRYAQRKGGLTPHNLSTATRHHLYDKALYKVGEEDSRADQSRWVAKV